MLIKLNDDLQTIVNLVKIDLIQKGSAGFCDELLNCPVYYPITSCWASIIIGGVEYKLSYSGYDEDIKDFSEEGTRKAYKKFALDYKLIEDSLIMGLGVKKTDI